MEKKTTSDHGNSSECNKCMAFVKLFIQKCIMHESVFSHILAYMNTWKSESVDLVRL